MTFEELASELDTTYDAGYSDRDKALGEFGREHSAELVAVEEQQGRTIEDLVDAANIGTPGYWAKAIREGMEVKDRLRILEHHLRELRS